MKRILVILELVLLCIVTYAQRVDIEGIWYWLNYNDNTANVAGKADNNLTAITIPSAVAYDDKIFSVTGIGSGAFKDCSEIISIVIPNSVTSIREYAFQNCNGLSSIEIPSSIISIENGTFMNCSGLSSINIPESVMSIGNNAFSGCLGLTSVNIPSSVTNIGGYAFSMCSGLTSVNIPSSVIHMYGTSFYGCSGLSSFTVDSNNQYFTAEDNVLFDKEKTTILMCVNSKTGTYNIPNFVTNIGQGAFENCIGLTNINIPNSVTKIGSYAFCYSGITSVTIPNSVTDIEIRTFQNCSKLLSVKIPSSVKSIGSEAFAECASLSKLFFNCNINNQYDVFYRTKIEELYIGDDVTIVYPCFTDKSMLRKVVLGKNVETIRADAFKGAWNLSDFYVTGDNLPYCYPNVFLDANISGATLHVKTNNVSYCKENTPWNGFDNIVILESDEPIITIQCSTPTITLVNGKLHFECETEGVEYHYSVVPNCDAVEVTCTDGDVVFDTATSYIVTCYATAEGYATSEIATATITVEKGDVNADGNITVADLTTMARYILTGEWSDSAK